MPELPEVETIKKDLEKLIVGKKILKIDPESAEAAVGAKIVKVGRRAKLIEIFLDNGGILLFHLKLTGRLLVRKNSQEKDNWQRITIFLSGGTELRFSDARKFGWMKFIKNKKELEKMLEKFGPEANTISPTDFKQMLSTSRRPVKVVLMDQAKIAGIGNIYAAEALHLAKISPKRSANSISPDEKEKLLSSIKKVLKAGIKYRGASDQYYLDALGKKGYYQEHFLVYNRAGKKCPECGGVIKKIVLAGRGTYYCPICQV
ncbi:MAG: bifunctional DNA-formamidopyrimidine glycosylase/DNA-(apurinic or apyrimidinic site) lyase [bacterium]|nr:bifunctional DNA-formamidopyrimidine glycosylase/DNA-(apurinic or apyrimidinic site) lyase [bacterium]